MSAEVAKRCFTEQELLCHSRCQPSILPCFVRRSFAQELAKEFWSKGAGERSYIYNGVWEGFKMRTDRGLLIEPGDAVGSTDGGGVEDMLFLESKRRGEGRHEGVGSTLELRNPYPLVRADISSTGACAKKTFVLFEHDEEQDMIVEFCKELIGGQSSECEEDLAELVLQKKREGEEKSERERDNRLMCERRFVGGVTIAEVWIRYIRMGGVVGESAMKRAWR